MSRLHAAAFGWFLVVIGAAAVACQAVELTTESQCDRKYELVLQTELRHSQQLQALQSRLTALENQQAEIKTDVNSLQASFHKQVAFTAAFPGFNRDLNIGENAAIRFNKTVTNIGNGYNSLDGHFTAPYAGVYAFFASLRTLNAHGYTLLGIYKGHELLASVTAEGRGDPWDRSSTFVVTHLDKGDQVYVRRYGGETYLEAGVLTTFSGVLVSPD